MKPLIIAAAIVAFVSGATATLAADDVTGDYCLESSASNGGAPFTYEQLPRTDIFRRGSDCTEDKQVAIWIEDGTLRIEGFGMDLIFSGAKAEKEPAK
jgi:hypothetical protein